MIDYKFQDGDYFIWNKLSDWQKEYLLENSHFILPKTYLDLGAKYETIVFTTNRFDIATEKSFLCQREVSFNDIYKTKWVTFNSSADILGCCNLIDGKDYQVEEVSSCGNSYLILDETGRNVMYHKSFFDKIESHKHNEFNTCKASEEDERGFEGLVYVPPEKDSYIKLNTLSQQQKEFLADTLVWCGSSRFEDNLNFLIYSKDCERWFLSIERALTRTRYKTYFNDIFVYKD